MKIKNKRKSHQKVLNDMEFGRVHLVIASEASARGLDFAWLKTVFIFDIPRMTADYLHMAGRVSRLNTMGFVVTFVVKTDDFAESLLLEKHIKQSQIDLKYVKIDILNQRIMQKFRSKKSKNITNQMSQQNETMIDFNKNKQTIENETENEKNESIHAKTDNDKDENNEEQNELINAREFRFLRGERMYYTDAL